MVSCDVTPDRITAKEWDISQAGNVEAAVLNETTYSETSLIEMKPDRIYELTLEWDQKKGTGTGGYGSASYVIVTE